MEFETKENNLVNVLLKEIVDSSLKDMQSRINKIKPDDLNEEEMKTLIISYGINVFVKIIKNARSHFKYELNDYINMVDDTIKIIGRELLTKEELDISIINQIKRMETASQEGCCCGNCDNPIVHKNIH